MMNLMESQTLASMGPQLYRCGNSKSTPSAAAGISTALQWGRNFIVAEIHGRHTCPGRTLSCFNGAATLSLRKWGRLALLPVCQQPASMGPQLYRCGNRLGSERATLHRHSASMGPQLYRCGNDYGALQPVPDERASMGPQLYRCGNLSMVVRFGPVAVSLQWGRNFIVAEICRVPGGAGGDVRASMGPQLYRCGNCDKVHYGLVCILSFNGAATLSLRKF